MPNMEDSPDLPMFSLSETTLPSRRAIDIVVLEEVLKGRIVDLMVLLKSGEKKSLNTLILPSERPAWTIRQGNGNVILGCDNERRELVIPEYIIMFKGEPSAHGYRRTAESLIGGEGVVEAHDYLSLDGAGISLLHEAGHAHHDRKYERYWDDIWKIRDLPAKDWTPSAFQLFRKAIMPMEEVGWEYARVRYYELREDEGIDLEPNLSDGDINDRIHFALGTYRGKIHEYERLHGLDHAGEHA